MSYTYIHHPRTSTRGHATHKRHPSIQIITDVTQSPSSPTLSTSSMSSSRTHTPLPYAPEPPSPSRQHHQLARRTSFTRERQGHISAQIIERSPDSYPSRRLATSSSSRTSPKTLPRAQDLTIIQRSSSDSDIAVQEELAHYYRHTLAHRQQSQSPKTLPRRYDAELPLVLVEHPHYGRELVRAETYRHDAYIVERSPPVEPRRAKSVKVVEKKEVVIMRDEAGRWVKVRRTVR